MTGDTTGAAVAARGRWIAFSVVCVATLMIVLDTTIVNVALPAIGADLRFTETSLVWVVNAYLLTFGGCLLLGGRLGDLYGPRRWFAIGLAVFTAASCVCGLAPNQPVLIAARAVQGVGGAVVDAISLALVMRLFVGDAERTKAMGVYGFVCAAGGSIGVLAGGLLTHFLSWHWVFLVNIPIGLAVLVSTRITLPPLTARTERGPLDLPGAVTITAALMLAVYAVVDGNRAGWASAQTIGLLAAAAVSLIAFVVVERRAVEPLMPLRLFRNGRFVAAVVVALLWASAMFAWFFLSALYMQGVLSYDSKAVGLAFLPSNIVMAVLSIGVSARIVTRFGTRAPIVVGMAAVAVGLAWFARAPVDGRFVVDLLPGMLLLGIGAGLALNPLLMAAMNDVGEADAGIASGIVNTAFMMGGALGLAILASIADAAGAGGASQAAELARGYRIAFAVGAGFAAIAAGIAWRWIGPAPRPTPATAAQAAWSNASSGGRRADDSSASNGSGW